MHRRLATSEALDPGWLLRISPRAILALGVCLLLAINLAPRTIWLAAPGCSWLHVGLAAVLLVVWLTAGLVRPRMLRRWLLLGAPLALAAGALAWLSARQALGLQVLVRGQLSLATVLALQAALPAERLESALAAWGVPWALRQTVARSLRYRDVLLRESSALHRARQARCFGRRRRLLRELQIKTAFVGMLLVRAAARAQRVHAAMLARGARLTRG